MTEESNILVCMLQEPTTQVTCQEAKETVDFAVLTFPYPLHPIPILQP